MSKLAAHYYGEVEVLESADDIQLIDLVRSLSRDDPYREAAYEHLINRYSALVASCARRYAHTPEQVEELTQAGYLGLLTAITRFDPQVGMSLCAYAWPCISGEIKRHFRDKRWQVHIRRTLQELRIRVVNSEGDLVQQLGRLPTDRELADYLGLTETDVRDARRADQAFHLLSLNASVSAEPDAETLGDLISDDENNIESSLDSETIWSLIERLPEREQRVVSMRFYGNMTQSQIGEKLGVSQMHVSRLLHKALSFMRDQLLGDS